MQATASLILPHTYCHETGGTYLFEEDIKVALELTGTYGTPELLGWKIEQIAVERWSVRDGKFMPHWLSNSDPFVALIIAALGKSEAFADRVREAAAELCEAA